MPRVLGVGVPIDGSPRRGHLVRGQPHRGPVVDERHVLDDPGEGHRRRWVRAVERFRVQPADFPGELRARPVEGEEHHLDLAGRHRRFGDRCIQIGVVGHGQDANFGSGRFPSGFARDAGNP